MKIILKNDLETSLDEDGEPIIEFSSKGDSRLCLLSDERRELMLKIVQYVNNKNLEFEIKEQK